jgi:hypothetical protein
MGKLNKIILIMGVVTLFFHFAGSIPDSPSEILLHLLLSPENIASSSFMSKIIAVTTALTASGIVIGSLISGKIETALKVVPFLFFVELIYGWIKIIRLLIGVNEAFGIIVGAPFLLYSLMVAFDWLFGRD